MTDESISILLSPASNIPPPYPAGIGIMVSAIPERGMADILGRIRRGELKLHSLEGELPPDEAIRVRRQFIEEERGTHLSQLGSYSIPMDQVVRRNCENVIGAVQVPVGIAGPLHILGEYADGTFFLPLATTEGALVASVNRGCSAITAAGGAQVRILSDAMTRAPVFAARDIVHAREIASWASAHIPELRAAAEATTRHGKLLGLSTEVAGTSVFVRMEFATGDAMGMNMVTIASKEAADLICRETGSRLVSLSGNVCTDKKPAAVNVVRGRGRSAAAGLFLPDDLVRERFKTNAATMAEVNTRKNLVGSARAGSLGFNAHAANIIAAIFIACGQDPAHVVEGSLAVVTADPAPGGIYVAVTLPALPVGTVGGGTGVATQAECLSLLGCAGGGDPPGSHARKFAEIVAVAVLAGELSLLAALGAQHLAKAHQSLGRG